MEVLDAFAEPSDVDATCAQRGLDRRTVDRLFDCFGLINPDDTSALARGLLAPADPDITIDRALAALAEWRGERCLLGIPCDFAHVPPLSPAHGPAEIRRAMRERGLPMQPVGERPREPTVIGDLGDVTWVPEDDIRAVATRVRLLVSKMLAAATIPVVLGGDHSLTLALLQALGSTGDYGVLHLDAHVDRVPSDGALRAPLGHASVFTYALDDPRMRRLVQVGVHTRLPPLRDDRVVVIHRDASAGPAAEVWLREIPTDLRWHLSIDLDVVDPGDAPEVTVPVPSGMPPGSVLDLIDRCGSALNLVSCDVVEVCAGLAAPNRAAHVTAQIIDRLEIVCRSPVAQRL